MKKLFLFLTITLVFSCSKNDDSTPANPIDQLPPATQTGKNTFGCLLDGEVFKPGNFPNVINCYYQLVDGEYYFLVSAANYKNNVLKVVRLRTEKKQVKQGETYDLYEWNNFNASGNYTLNNIESYTSQKHTGKLTITKLTNQIVSGTFFFDVQDENGVVNLLRN